MSGIKNVFLSDDSGFVPMELEWVDEKNNMCMM